MIILVCTRLIQEHVILSSVTPWISVILFPCNYQQNCYIPSMKPEPISTALCWIACWRSHPYGTLSFSSAICVSAFLCPFLEHRYQREYLFHYLMNCLFWFRSYSIGHFLLSLSIKLSVLLTLSSTNWFPALSHVTSTFKSSCTLTTTTLLMPCLCQRCLVASSVFARSLALLASPSAQALGARLKHDELKVKCNWIYF